MKSKGQITINNLLGIGGVVSLIASPVIAFGTIQTDIAKHDVRIASLEESYKKVETEIHNENNLLIKIATKLGISTDSLDSQISIEK